MEWVALQSLDNRHPGTFWSSIGKPKWSRGLLFRQIAGAFEL
jgi:hypothetical protein